MIGHAVDELLLNAFAAEPKSAVSLAARLSEEGRHLVIQVGDDGMGMDEHTLAHAKDPFFSAKAAGRRVGMGLTRAQQYAAAHGGGIDLRSAIGKGTTATMTIALERGQTRADTPHASSENQGNRKLGESIVEPQPR
jgi:signal transduction histidine kinase